MKKILTLSGPHPDGVSPPYAGTFSRYIEGYDFKNVDLGHISFEISPDEFIVKDGQGVDIASYDLVMLREYSGQFLDVAFAVSHYLALNGTAFFNRNYLSYNPVSKLAQASIFHACRLPFPRSYFSLDHQQIIKAASAFGFPAILKDVHASHGNNNFLVHGQKELVETLSANQAVKFVLQEYHPNDNDYRVLMTKDRPLLQIKRTGAGGSHLNNTSKGGIGTLSDDVPQEVLSQARSLVEKLNVDMAGVDIIQDKNDGKYYFLEINFQPQIVSGALVEDKMSAFKSFLDSYFTRMGLGS